MSERRYTYSLVFGSANPRGEWKITDMGDRGYSLDDDPVVFRCPTDEKDEFEMPATFKAKYEELCGRPEFIEFDEDAACGTTNQIVEMITSDESRFDQLCKFGCLVPGHSVYCHNDGWLYSPRKCHRTWYTGGETRDEDCPGFKPNPRYRAD